MVSFLLVCLLTFLPCVLSMVALSFLYLFIVVVLASVLRVRL